MICYFLYMIDITILYLFTYDRVTSCGAFMNSAYRNGRPYYVYIYHTARDLSVPFTISHFIHRSYDRLLNYIYGPHINHISKNNFIIIAILFTFFV